jgi:hypothetical protein
MSAVDSSDGKRIAVVLLEELLETAQQGRHAILRLIGLRVQRRSPRQDERQRERTDYRHGVGAVPHAGTRVLNLKLRRRRAPLSEAAERELQLVLSVRGGHDCAHARLVARDGRKPDPCANTPSVNSSSDSFIARAASPTITGVIGLSLVRC